MITNRIKVEGMKCAGCVAHVEKALKQVPGVLEATVTLNEGAIVRHENVPLKTLLAAIARAGAYAGHVTD